jgi:hypothetical protein
MSIMAAAPKNHPLLTLQPTQYTRAGELARNRSRVESARASSGFFGQKTQNTDAAAVGNDRRAPGRRNATTVGTCGPGGDDAVRRARAAPAAERGRLTLRSFVQALGSLLRVACSAVREVGCREQP